MRRAPACWDPPAALPELPAGEAVREWPLEVWGAQARFPPPSAPGYQRAARMGLLPPAPPALPPEPVPGLSSWDRLRAGLLLWFGTIVVLLVVGDAVGALGALAISVVPAVVGVLLLLSTSRRDELEFAAGYTSGAAHAGLWRLGRDGRVLRRPDLRVPPPGWYPSPFYPGLLQRWDGPGWKPLPRRWWRNEGAYFRRPPTPFL